MILIKNTVRIFLLFLTLFRNKNLVLLRSCHNVFTGNCKYVHIEIKKHFSQKKLIWITDTEKQAQEFKNLEIAAFSYEKNSFYLTILILIAKYHFSDGCWLTWDSFSKGTRAISIDFWHGLGVKYDMCDAVSNIFLINKFENFFLRLNKKNFYHISSSNYLSNMVLRAYRMPLDMGRVLGAPRISPLLMRKNELEKFIDAEGGTIKEIKEKIKNFDKTYLYVPTYRDNNENFLNFLNLDLVALNKSLYHKNAFMIFKMHPFCDLKIESNYSNIISLNKNLDVYLLLALVDCIITDYCSLYFDIMWKKEKQILLLHGDIEIYKKNNRDIYQENLRDMQTSTVLSNFKQLIDFINGKISYRTTPQTTINKYWDPFILKEPHAYLKFLK